MTAAEARILALRNLTLSKEQEQKMEMIYQEINGAKNAGETSVLLPPSLSRSDGKDGVNELEALLLKLFAEGYKVTVANSNHPYFYKITLAWDNPRVEDLSEYMAIMAQIDEKAKDGKFMLELDGQQPSKLVEMKLTMNGFMVSKTTFGHTQIYWLPEFRKQTR